MLSGRAVRLFSFVLALCLSAAHAWAAESDSGSMTLQEASSLVESKLTYRSGAVTLPGGAAVLSVPEGFHYLDPKDARFVMEEVWGNAAQEDTLGLLVPPGFTALGTGTYAVNLYVTSDGHVDDSDAASIDYSQLLEQMHQDAADAAPELRKAGYPVAQIVGWAAAPYYDAAQRKLHWAKELKFEGSDSDTLNYDVRVLGKDGYLTMQVIAEMADFPRVRRDMPKILASAEFTPGNRYADFDPKFGKVAAYGLGALVAGKVAAKVGFFVVILKFWKLLIVGVAVFWGKIKAFFRRRPKTAQESVDEASAAPKTGA